MGRKTGTAPPMKELTRWIRSRTVREKVTMGAIAGLVALVLLKVFVKDHSHFFVAAQAAHAAGILVLIYKLTISKTCSGLSLKTQELTAIYIVLRILAGVIIRHNVHFLLDSLTLGATLWVIYMMRFDLKSTYMQDLDNMPLHYVLVACAILALIGHPEGYHFVFMYPWAFSFSIEAVSVLPQLRLIQNAKMVEPFTAHYVFALGIARFFEFAHWIIQIIETGGGHFFLVGEGHLWVLVALLCEVVQTFILADFCYYYVKSAMEGQIIMRLPSFV